MRWGSRHNCEAQAGMSENNKRQQPVIELHWYGWTIDLKKGVDLQIIFCPWCGSKLKEEATCTTEP